MTDDTPGTVEITDEDYSAEFDAEELADALRTVDFIESDVRRLTNHLNELRAGPLTDQHVRDILYSEVPPATKSEVRTLFETMEEAHNETERELAVRLVASLSTLSMSDTREMFEEMEELRDEYDDLLTDDEPEGEPVDIEEARR